MRGSTALRGGDLWGSEDPAAYARDNFVGTVEHVTEKVQAYVDAGCREFVLWFRDYPSSESVERFAAQVIPDIRVNAMVRSRRLLVVAFGAVLVVSLALRFWTRSALWFDEALSVNIARLPLGRISGALRHDGHPPLYYYLLHWWIELFGIGDVAVRALSGVFAVATLPLAWLAGRRIGGKRVAWLVLIVVATSPYAFRYATEARMYAIVMFLVFAGYLAVRRALDNPTLPWLALVAAITAALALTQYWDLYLIGVIGAALLFRALRAPDRTDRRSAVRVLGAMALGSASFLVWLPVFLEQVAHTGTPWGDPEVPWFVVPRALIAFAGGDEHSEAFVLAFALLVLVLLATFGRALDDRHIEIDLRTQSAVRWEAAAAFGVVLVGASLSFLSGTTFEPRYAAVAFPIFALVVAFGLLAFADRRVQASVVAVLVVLGLAGGVRNVVTNRTQAAQSAAVIARESKPGDVVAYCPDQIGPDVSRLLRDVPGLHQLTFADRFGPERVNWTDYLDRIHRTDPAKFARTVLDRAAGRTIWYVATPGLVQLEGKCEAIARLLDAARTPHERVVPDVNLFEVQGLTEYRPS